MSWITPKTDWVASDRFNITDYNRIRNNISFLHEEAVKVFGGFNIEDMGEDISTYTAMWDYQMFNAIEDNIDILNEHMLKESYGAKKTYYENGVFINYEELNRIESASLRMYEIINGWYEGLYKLEFTVGRPKGIYR